MIVTDQVNPGESYDPLLIFKPLDNLDSVYVCHSEGEWVRQNI